MPVRNQEQKAKKGQNGTFCAALPHKLEPRMRPGARDLTRTDVAVSELIALKLLVQRAILRKQALVFGKRIKPAFRPPRVSFE
jgi:hypothetical protein